MKEKYVVCPGGIKSQYDGDLHHISAGRLMELYRVDPKDCFIMDSPEKMLGFRWEDYIQLRPRSDGNYELPSL